MSRSGSRTCLRRVFGVCLLEGPQQGIADEFVEAAPTLQSIAVTPINTSLPTGETEQFTAIGTLSDNNNTRTVKKNREKILHPITRFTVSYAPLIRCDLDPRRRRERGRRGSLCGAADHETSVRPGLLAHQIVIVLKSSVLVTSSTEATVS